MSELNLEHRFTYGPHISQDSLPEMPAQQLVHWPTRIVTEPFIEIPAGNTISVPKETHNLVAILMQHELATYGFSRERNPYIWIDGHIVLIKQDMNVRCHSKLS